MHLIEGRHIQALGWLVCKEDYELITQAEQHFLQTQEEGGSCRAMGCAGGVV